MNRTDLPYYGARRFLRVVRTGIRRTRGPRAAVPVRMQWQRGSIVEPATMVVRVEFRRHWTTHMSARLTRPLPDRGPGPEGCSNRSEVDKTLLLK
jgi:hypothetical protein